MHDKSPIYNFMNLINYKKLRFDMEDDSDDIRVALKKEILRQWWTRIQNTAPFEYNFFFNVYLNFPVHKIM